MNAKNLNQFAWCHLAVGILIGGLSSYHDLVSQVFLDSAVRYAMSPFNLSFPVNLIMIFVWVAALLYLPAAILLILKIKKLRAGLVA